MTYIFNDSQKWQKNTTGLIRTWAGGLPYEQYLYGGLTLYLSHLPALIVFRDCRISCFLFNSSHICQFLNYVLHSRFFLAQRQVEDVLELSSCKESRVRCWIYMFVDFRTILRAASPKYQLDLEIAKKSNFFKLAQNEALRALVTKISF